MSAIERKKQITADIIIPIRLFKIDGTDAIGLALNTLSTKIIKPDGTALTGYTEATFSEPNGDGVYVCKFPANAAVPAFTLENQANPYTVTLSSSVAGVGKNDQAVWIVSKYQWELASSAELDSIGSVYPLGVINAAVPTLSLAEPIIIHRGDHEEYSFSVVDAAGLPMDITNYRFWFYLKKKYDDQTFIIETEITKVAPTQGGCKIILTPVLTDKPPAQNLVGEIKRTKIDQSEPLTVRHYKVHIEPVLKKF